MPRHYQLVCPVCAARLDDDGLILECEAEHSPALLTTEYATRRFESDTGAEGIYRYRSWLPVVRTLAGPGSTAIYRSERLNSIIGLPNLWIAFNGYWPEQGATLATSSFKDLEAYSVLARLPEQHDQTLVVASAGNTGAAFARGCSQNKIRCLIVIPANGLERMWFVEPLDPCVKIVSLIGSADYYDAILLANRVAHLPGFFPEGGVKNVARRDGIGTTMLHAVETIGRLPDYYFQAIGSGTGGIAVHEAAKRLIADGRYGQKLPQLMLSQNMPFAPIYRSWKLRRQELIQLDLHVGKRQLERVIAPVLSNQRPPYSIRGGVFNILTESQGDMLAATNRETRRAIELFEETEAIDIDPAAGVAFATLITAAMCGQIDRKALVLLHITGGGCHRYRLEHHVIPAEPALQLDLDAVAIEKALEQVAELFQ